MSENGKNKVLTGSIYLTYLFLAWASYVAFLYPKIAVIDGLLGEITEETIRVIIFLAPLYFIHKTIQPLSFELMGVTNKLTQGIKIGFISSAIFLSIVLPLTLLSSGKSISFEEVSSISFLSTVSTAVITEEIVFRGYLSSVFEQYGRTLVILITTILFVLIHYSRLVSIRNTFNNWRVDSDFRKYILFGYYPVNCVSTL